MEKIIKQKLEDTFNDVTDLIEPESMEKVLMILDQCRMEDDEYMELLVNKLRDEEITWEQPWFQRDYRLTRKTKIHNKEDECNTGTFTLKEGKLVQRNWQNFIQEYDVPDTPLYLARWRNRVKSKSPKRSAEERVRNFVTAYLARGLRRHLYQVHRYFLAHYGNPVKSGHYTHTEEKIMEICFYHQPFDAVVILKDVLGREPRGIYKRLIDYYHGTLVEKQKINWTLELATKLVRLLMEYSECSLEELNHMEFDVSLWRKIEEQFGHQYSYIRKFWYSKLHVQLFAKCAMKLKSIRRFICKKLRQSPYEVWTDIRWKELALQFPKGFTKEFIFDRARRLFSTQPQYRSRPLPELLDEVLAEQHRWKRRRLKTIKFSKNRTLKYFEYDISLKELMLPKSSRQVPLQLMYYDGHQLLLNTSRKIVAESVKSQRLRSSVDHSRSSPSCSPATNAL